MTGYAVISLGYRRSLYLRRLRRREARSLLFIGDEAHVYTAGRGLLRTEHLLEVLAGVRMHEGDALAGLAAAVRARAGELTSCILVLSAWDEARRRLVDELRRAGLQLLVLAVVPAGLDFDMAAGVRPLRIGQVQADLLAL